MRIVSSYEEIVVTGARRAMGGLLLTILMLIAISAHATERPERVEFQGRVEPLSEELKARMTGVSWRPGCPVPLSRLRLLTVTHWGFDSRVHTGELVLHESVADSVLRVMKRLFTARFPIHKMRLIDEYGGDDFVSIEDNNTSGFNGRRATGSRNWSRHAYGLAIDINPIENPYVNRGRTSHPASEPYLDRSTIPPGMAYRGGILVESFRAIGWNWGGAWTRGIKDYQHFAAPGPLPQ
jgi:hypothetical protein